ncbi:acyl-CoA dehydratase activase-related protein [Natroniella acetigena]|uniref:acyl-CoA dehydratase activase-related protein n=1 Tax=Natroniella acetigena TaxID=52004 RepID=UPI00200B69B3|nr:acyl-CoA dehydratase activase-related protein [Natroniella acetigena]MCK8827091.1 acyl-CoA dehydratase activase-related protein [Natroniella acetigena]
MKVTFPHMGTMSIPVKSMLKELGLEVVVPPPITKKTLDLGVKHSPEFACLPLKMNVGNYIEALEQGADTILMGGGVGPCRFGYYGEVQEEILEDLGYDFEMIILEPLQGDWKELFKTIKLLVGNIAITKIKSAWQKGWAKAKAVDQLNRIANQTRSYLINRYRASEVYERGLKLIRQAETIEEVETKVGLIEEEFNNLERDEDFEPLKVGLVGEIYVVLEPFTNLQIEKKLGEKGVLVDKSIYLTDWMEGHLFPSFLKRDQEGKKVKEVAQPYLNHFVGGHGLESVGETVLYSQKGYDGVVQLFPFTCMPEIIAESILPTVSRDLNIPVLSLTMDEHTGEAGYVTRLEAFIDLLERKSRKEKVI